jgi:hypothetical protein
VSPTAVVKPQIAQTIAQRDGVRVVGFRKCGHTSIINTFCTLRNEFLASALPSTPWSKEPGDKSTPLEIRQNYNRRTQHAGALRGYLDSAEHWPKPHTVIVFIRDPARRALSAYQHFIVRTVRENFLALGFTPDMSFAQYCKHLKTVDLAKDLHIEPYYDQLAATGTEDSRFLLAPLELISEVWPAFVNDLGLDDVPLGVWRQNNGGYQAAEFLTDELTDYIRDEVYSQDYSLWQTVYNETRATLPSVRYKTFEELISLVNQ